MNIIVATSESGGIGLRGTIPWKCPEDMAHFSAMTRGSVVVMGRLTWESIGSKPLPDRINVIISQKYMSDANSNADQQQQVMWFESPTDAFATLNILSKTKIIYIIGGSSIYNFFLKCGLVSKIYLSVIKETGTEFDRHFTIPPEQFTLTSTEDRLSYTLKIYTYKNNEENQVMKLINTIKNVGELTMDRTGVGCKTVFGNNALSFDLRYGKFPLATHRSIPFRHVFEELMFFIRGQTDVNILRDAGVNIWNANTSRAALDKLGLTDVPEYTMINGYGEHWRRFGSGTGKYSDQIKTLIENIINIKTGKDYSASRRLIILSWNPDKLDRCALPGCHFAYQFNYSRETNELSCFLLQRSSDVPLALNWNIATGALLTRLICTMTHCNPGMLHLAVSNAHIYLNHLSEIDAILQSPTTNYPIIKYNKPEPPATIEQFDFSDFVMYFYRPSKLKVNLPMNV